MNHYIVIMHWPPEGRSRYGHGYNYLVLADTEKEAIDIAEKRWAGKQGGANPHTTTVTGRVDGVRLFTLAELPQSRSMQAAVHSCGSRHAFDAPCPGDP